MIWSGAAFTAVMITMFVLFLVISSLTYIGSPIFPDYWEPYTLFDLGRITGGLSLDDVAFMFFSGGTAAFLYEITFRKKIRPAKKEKHHAKALIIAIVASLAFALIFKMNLIYPLIVFLISGAIAIIIERKDLAEHSFYGGVSFLAIYFAAFLLLNLLFPAFIEDVYHLENLSGILIAGIPFEELAYAFSFGMLWAPMYEYEHGARDAK